MRTLLVTVATLAALVTNARADQSDAAPANLASFGAGAVVVRDPVAYDSSWSAFWLLDEDPTTGWASPKGDLAAKVVVIELADRDAISEVGFDTGHVDGADGTRGVRDIVVEISDKVDTGYAPLAKVSLAPGKDGQRFKVTTPGTGRYLRLTLENNNGDGDYVELMGFAAYGKLVTKMPTVDISGAYDSDYGMFHLRQVGASASGCYERANGLLANGGFDGRVLRFTWSQGSGDKRQSGPAVLVFPADGKSFLGLWWPEGQAGLGGRWDGKWKSKTVGSCPNWKDAQDGGVADALRKDGRARVYGINFDLESDHLRDESHAVLDQLVAVAKAEPTWKLGIEGHTDSTGTAEHNQPLSEKRAAAVKAYLVAAGVDAGRLTTQGFGATKPVATNDTSLGRSQNRRVEVVKK